MFLCIAVRTYDVQNCSHSGRRNRPGGYGRNPPRCRSDRNWRRMDKAPGRSGCTRCRGQSAAGRNARRGQRRPRDAQGPDCDAQRHRFPQRERRAAPEAKPVCQLPPCPLARRRAVAVRKRRSHSRSRKHGRPLQRAGTRSGARCGRKSARRDGESFGADRKVRVRNGPTTGTQARHVRPQGEHLEAERRAVPADVRAGGRDFCGYCVR